jgi:integrase
MIKYQEASAFVDVWWKETRDISLSCPFDHYLRHLQVVCDVHRSSNGSKKKMPSDGDAAWQLLCCLINHSRLNTDMLQQCLEFFENRLIPVLQKNILEGTIFFGDASSQKKFTLILYSDLLTVLNYLIDEGNYKGLWRLCLFNPMQRSKSRINPFNDKKKWQLYLGISNFEEDVNALLSCDDLDQKTQLGVLCFSLMKDALILDAHKLILILNHLFLAKELTLVNDRLFIPANVFTQGQGLGCYLPYTTEVLFYRLKLNSVALTEPIDVFSCLSHLATQIANRNEVKYKKNEQQVAIKQLSIKKSFKPKRMKQWLDAIVALVRQRQPSFVVHFAQDEMPAYALKNEGNVRIFAHDIVEAINEIKVEPKNTGNSIGLDGALWRDIRSVFDGKRVDKNINNTLEKVKNELAALIETKTIDDNHLLLLRYASSALTQKQRNHTTMSPSKILHHLSSVGKKLVMFAEDRIISQLAATDRFELYQNVIETALSQDHEKTMRYNLKRFEKWLTNANITQSVMVEEDFEELFDGADSNRGHVNANVLTIDEYLHLLGLLKMQLIANADDHVTYIATIVLILGFRCGLRRNEVLELRFGDYIACQQTPRILLREGKLNNENAKKIITQNEDSIAGGVDVKYDEGKKLRELKSTNAKRNLFLIDLMPDDEWTILNDWHKVRLQQLILSNCDTRPIEPLFLLQYYQPTVMHVKVMEYVMKLIRTVTQTPDFKYHQLRHSFASWQMLAMFSAEYDLDMSDFFSHFPETVRWLNEAKTRKAMHLPTGPASNSRKYGYWLKQVMGHANIEMTLANYIHFMDVILLKMADRQSKITQQRAAQLSGLSISLIKKSAEQPSLFIAKNLQDSVIKKGLCTFNGKKPKGYWQAPTMVQQIVNGQKTNNFWQLPERVLRLLQQNKSMHEIQQYLPELSLDKLEKLAVFFEHNKAFRLSALNKKEQEELQYQLTALSCYNANWIEELMCDDEDLPLNEFVHAFSQCLKPLCNIENGGEDNYFPDVPDFRLLIKKQQFLNSLLRAENIFSINIDVVLWHDSRLNKDDLTNQMAYWRQFTCKPILTRKIGPRGIGEYGYLEIRYKYTDNRKKKNIAVYWLLVQLAIMRKLV